MKLEYSLESCVIQRYGGERLKLNIDSGAISKTEFLECNGGKDKLLAALAELLGTHKNAIRFKCEVLTVFGEIEAFVHQGHYLATKQFIDPPEYPSSLIINSKYEPTFQSMLFRGRLNKHIDKLIDDIRETCELLGKLKARDFTLGDLCNAVPFTQPQVQTTLAPCPQSSRTPKPKRTTPKRSNGSSKPPMNSTIPKGRSTSSSKSTKRGKHSS